MNYIEELREKVGHRPLILPGAVVVLINNKNQVLLQHRTDGGWGLPGGLMELGESLEEAARREVKEETGLVVGELYLVNVFSGPEFYFKVDNGDELYSVTAVYISRDFNGEWNIDQNESLEVRFFDFDQLPNNLTEEYRTYLDSVIEEL
ncbi:NUDIX hydrolase [Radiobacillus kanasensis]|uniref:NUDIX hydrolase n=1 Tax=Radiobacillus kanasensis TaxID=2844358 RepID=UPI001E62E899|nr:NUDIX hydrolase [Radiobacillus kanasensis]UFT98369.1 NUDIX hydrolase [Radiobacillus kanasensis]